MTVKDVYRRIQTLEEQARKQLAVCTELRAHVAALKLQDEAPAEWVCRSGCAPGKNFRSERALLEHVQVVHGDYTGAARLDELRGQA